MADTPEMIRQRRYRANRTAKIARLEAENAEMRRALWPFARAADGWDGNPDGSIQIDNGEGQDITVNDLRIARNAIGEKQP